MREALISLAQIAGEAIREVYERGTWETTWKADRSPLTEADRASHKILCEGLARLAPDVPILSEESEEVPYDVRKTWDSYYLIDPLDGTREFQARIPEFAINIALIQRGVPIMGLIYSPLKRTAYYANKGEGVIRSTGGRMEQLVTAREDAEVCVLLSHTDRSAGLDDLIAKIPKASVTRMGSSLKFCAIAEGEADFYPRLKPSMEWDTAAGTILVQEAGGIVCGLNGEPIGYNRQDMLNPPFYVIGKSLFKKLSNWKLLLLNDKE